MVTRKTGLTTLLCMALTLIAGAAMAFTAPTNSLSVGYDFYDYANKVSTGAVGWAIGIGGLASAGFLLFRQQVIAAAAMAFGVITILDAPSIVSALGYLM